MVSWRVTVFPLVAQFLLLINFAHASSFESYEGVWKLQVAEKNLFILSLKKEGESLAGKFERPEAMQLSGSIFLIESNKLRIDPLVNARLSGEDLHLSFKNSLDQKTVTEFVLARRGDDALLSISGIAGVGPWILRKGADGTHASVGWDLNRVYTETDSDIPNTELAQLYSDDQTDRTQGSNTAEAIGVADKKRMDRVRDLLKLGYVRAPADFMHAAFILQHGTSEDDFILAHTLALIAVSKGEGTAVWLAAATLDRYLQSIGKPQIYGTQFSSSDGLPKKPFNTELVPAEIKRHLGIRDVELNMRN